MVSVDVPAVYNTRFLGPVCPIWHVTGVDGVDDVWMGTGPVG